jgi:putative transcriptional regulator
LLVGERSGSGDIDESIVYSRFGIPIISLTTLSDHLLEGVPPFIFAAPGGLYVKLDSELLKKVREERGISLGTLAEIAGVSRRTIQMYETGMGAMIDVAIRLEEFLNQPIVTPVNPFQHCPHPKPKDKGAEHPPSSDLFGREVFQQLRGMGFSIVPTTRSPFEALSKDKHILILTGLGKDESKLKDKAMAVADISKVTGRCSVIFIEKSGSKHNIGGTPIVGKDELRKITEACILYELVGAREIEEKHKV